MSFHDSDHQFSHQVTPDTGASKTIFAKNIIDRQWINVSPKPDALDLYTAAGEPMTFNPNKGGGVESTHSTFNGLPFCL